MIFNTLEELTSYGYRPLNIGDNEKILGQDLESIIYFVEPETVNTWNPTNDMSVVSGISIEDGNSVNIISATSNGQYSHSYVDQDTRLFEETRLIIDSNKTWNDKDSIVEYDVYANNPYLNAIVKLSINKDFISNHNWIYVKDIVNSNSYDVTILSRNGIKLKTANTKMTNDVDVKLHEIIKSRELETLTISNNGDYDVSKCETVTVSIPSNYPYWTGGKENLSDLSS